MPGPTDIIIITIIIIIIIIIIITITERRLQAAPAGPYSKPLEAKSSYAPAPYFALGHKN